MADVSERSLAVFDAEDLRRLSEIARKAMQSFIAGNPYALAEFPSKILCVALCQGAALHYVNKTNGVKDIDVGPSSLITAGSRGPAGKQCHMTLVLQSLA